MGKNKKQVSYKTLIITTVLTALIASIITNFSNKLSNYILGDKREIEYTILSSDVLNKKELDKIISKTYKKTGLDYSFDDFFIDKYHLTKIQLINNGSFIEDNLFMELDFCDNRVKILKVFGKLVSPEQREVEVELEKPPLEYSYFEDKNDTTDVKLNWSQPSGEKWNLCIYRSYSKNAGYGRINSQPLHKTFFGDKVFKGQRFWYAIANLNDRGIEGELTDPICWPDMVFNQPKFKNTKEIYFDNIENGYIIIAAGGG